MVAVRTTSNMLEVPLCSQGKCLVPDAYISFVVSQANTKFVANKTRTDQFSARFRELVTSTQGTSVPPQAPLVSATPAPSPPVADVGDGASATGTRSTQAAPEPCPCHWEVLEVKGVPSPLLARWGHSCDVVDDQVVVFGGFGGVGTQQRLNDVLAFEPGATHGTRFCCRAGLCGPTWRVLTSLCISVCRPAAATATWTQVRATADPEHGIPSARVRHASFTVTCSSPSSSSTRRGQGVVVWGGRASPQRPFQDGWLLSGVVRADSAPRADGASSTPKYAAPQWRRCEVPSEASPCARWGHAMCATDTNTALLFGGRSTSGVLGDLYSVRARTEGVPQLWWTQPETHGTPPCARYAHTLTYLKHARSVAVFGGYVS